MRSRIQAVVLPSETLGEFADEVRQIFAELGRAYSLETLAGECSPPIDVYETDDALEISSTCPASIAAAVRIVVKGTRVLIAGEKARAAAAAIRAFTWSSAATADSRGPSA